MLNNHQCGVGQILAHSTVENDLLTNWFWAMDQSQELSNPGVTATFIIRMEDVTARVLEGVTEGMSDEERDKKLNVNISTAQNDAVRETTYGAFIRPFYYGHEYYMLIT